MGKKYDFTLEQAIKILGEHRPRTVQGYRLLQEHVEFFNKGLLPEAEGYTVDDRDVEHKLEGGPREWFREAVLRWLRENSAEVAL